MPSSCVINQEAQAGSWGTGEAEVPQNKKPAFPVYTSGKLRMIPGFYHHSILVQYTSKFYILYISAIFYFQIHHGNKHSIICQAPCCMLCIHLIRFSCDVCSTVVPIFTHEETEAQRDEVTGGPQPVSGMAGV
jgi:hypothetical protein